MVIQRERANENEVTVHDVEEAPICLRAVLSFFDWCGVVSTFSIMESDKSTHFIFALTVISEHTHGVNSFSS